MKLAVTTDEKDMGQTKRSTLAGFKEYFAQAKFDRLEKSGVAQHITEEEMKLDFVIF